MIEMANACEIYQEIYTIIHEVGQDAEKCTEGQKVHSYSAQDSFQKCWSGFNKKKRGQGGTNSHRYIRHTEAVRGRWMGIGVLVSRISTANHSPQTRLPPS